MKKLNSNRDKKSHFLSKLKKWSSSSTAHGFPNIINNSNKFLRIMWTLCFLFSLSLCAYMIIKSVMDYMNFDVITQIRVISESPTIFPTVTICNVNPFVSEYAHDFLVNFFNLSNSTPPFEIPTGKAAQFVKSPEFGDENRKRLGFSINETIMYSQFNSEEVNLEDFEWNYDIFYGNCYKFNSGYNIYGEKIPIQSSTASGLINGLNLELFIGKEQKDFILKYHNGMHIFIHNHTNQPISLEGIALKPGTVTNIVINKSLIKKLPRPYSECQDLTNYDSILYNFIKNSSNSYRQKDCFDLCIHKRINEKCGCNDISYTTIYNLRPCVSDEDMECSYQAVLEISHNLNAKCAPLCPLECESIAFQLSTSIADYPSLAYGKALIKRPIFTKYFPNNSIDYEDLKQTVLAINIYFEDLKYTLINELPNQTLIGLISGIGGTLGLFLGMSLLSLVEVVEIVIDIFNIFFRKNQNKKINNNG